MTSSWAGAAEPDLRQAAGLYGKGEEPGLCQQGVAPGGVEGHAVLQQPEIQKRTDAAAADEKVLGHVGDMVEIEHLVPEGVFKGAVRGVRIVPDRVQKRRGGGVVVILQQAVMQLKEDAAGGGQDDVMGVLVAHGVPQLRRQELGGGIHALLRHQNVDVAAGAHPRLRIQRPEDGALQREKGDAAAFSVSRSCDSSRRCVSQR